MELEAQTYHIARLDHQDAQLLGALSGLRDGLMTHHRSFTSSERFMNFVTRRLNDETMLVALALTSARPVGYGLAFDVEEHPFMPEWTRAGYIAQFFVQPEHRRQGVGEMLMSFINDWFRSREIMKVWLNVSVANEPAQRFWRRHGFVAHAIRMKREQ